MDRLPCRSVSPDGQACGRPRGHQGRRGDRHWESQATAGRYWLDGINRPARWPFKDDDDGHRSEGELRAMRMGGVGW